MPLFLTSSRFLGRPAVLGGCLWKAPPPRPPSPGVPRHLQAEPGRWWVPVSFQFHSRTPPGQGFASLKVRPPSTSMRPQEKCVIRRERPNPSGRSAAAPFIQPNTRGEPRAAHPARRGRRCGGLHAFQKRAELPCTPRSRTALSVDGIGRVSTIALVGGLGTSRALSSRRPLKRTAKEMRRAWQSYCIRRPVTTYSLICATDIPTRPRSAALRPSSHQFRSCTML